MSDGIFETMPSSPPREDSYKKEVSAARQKKRAQNRIAQRSYRERLKKRIEESEKWRAIALATLPMKTPGTLQNALETEDVHAENEVNLTNHCEELHPPSQNPFPQSIGSVVAPHFPDIASKDPHDPIDIPQSHSNGVPTPNSLACVHPNIGKCDADSQAHPRVQVPLSPESWESIFDQMNTREEHDSSPHSLDERLCFTQDELLPNEVEGRFLPSTQGQNPQDHLISNVSQTNAITNLSDQEKESQALISQSPTSPASPNNRDGARLSFGHTGDDNGMTPLHVAATRGADFAAKILLDYGANPNTKDASGRTALHVAIQNGHLAITQTLLYPNKESSEQCNRRVPIDVNLKNDQGQAPLHTAVITGRKDIVLALLDSATLEKEIRDGNGWTALHLAVMNGSDEIMHLLLSRNAMVNSTIRPA
ncbi:MAG: hypothetical protein Q9157_004342 [Trypethelium eluteriae]